ncbi:MULTISPECIES: hypothetical protein [unclassified Acidovorax]|uniref:hypothetical protein n=1 Tax=unclassified Acidovorax TaxID=2684926 RepID=UPI001C441B39|nr:MULTISPECIES: hypothetical protein [unclassified Acidovorax]MBV7459474.1 hypothetical protein [Acidovorax sp. sif0632]MBV7464499.1 hypothetical protein [Acidovorax sp. sif0613]
MSEEYTLAQARREIAALNDNVIGQLNRIGALEAAVRELLHHTPTEVLESMARTYDVQMTMAMEKLPPPLQREQLWSHFLATMEEIVRTRRRLGQPEAHPGR